MGVGFLPALAGGVRQDRSVGGVVHKSPRVERPGGQAGGHLQGERYSLARLAAVAVNPFLLDALGGRIEIFDSRNYEQVPQTLGHLMVDAYMAGDEETPMVGNKREWFHAGQQHSVPITRTYRFTPPVAPSVGVLVAAYREGSVILNGIQLENGATRRLTVYGEMGEHGHFGVQIATGRDIRHYPLGPDNLQRAARLAVTNAAQEFFRAVV